MKSLPFIAAIILVFCAGACGGRDKKFDPPISANELWVNKAYADTLLLTGSPRAAQKVGDGTCLYFTDSVEPSVLVALGWHEGNWWTLQRSGDTIRLYDSSEKRNVGEIVKISPEQIRVGPLQFIKLHHPDRSRYDYNVVEELLFAGSYRTPDGATVSFSPDGRVTGLDTVKYFEPYVDYIGPGLDIDQVGLGANKDRATPYGFKFDKDTLLIYALKCLEGYDSTDNSCEVVDFGDLKWKLLKRH